MVKKWFKPRKHSGWEKTQSATTRRRLALKAHKGNYLSTARSLQALSNVSTDAQTKRLSRADSQYFYRKNRGSK